jgi:YHS domain-containing protein
MFRAIVISLILTIALRVILSTYSAFMEGLRGSGGDGPASRRGRGAAKPSQAVHMARDPVCGTFVVPERAVSVAVGRERVYFCSEQCRDSYRARTA